MNIRIIASYPTTIKVSANCICGGLVTYERSANPFNMGNVFCETVKHVAKKSEPGWFHVEVKVYNDAALVGFYEFTRDEFDALTGNIEAIHFNEDSTMAARVKLALNAMQADLANAEF